MSNKQAPRAARSTANAPKPTPDRAALRASPRLRISGGMAAFGGAVVVVAALLPWVTRADSTNVAGVGTIPGFGALALGIILIALMAVVYMRPDLPNARGLVWAGLFACIGIGVMTVIGALTVDTASGAQAAMGVLPSFAGGMIATMGIRGLLERR
jgi:hypothetical protein